jgi:hypothetical protein
MEPACGPPSRQLTEKQTTDLPMSIGGDDPPILHLSPFMSKWKLFDTPIHFDTRQNVSAMYRISFLSKNN